MLENKILDPGLFPNFQVSKDDFLNGRLSLYQPLMGYRAAIDPVFLAAAVQAPQSGTVLDLGVGSGVASCCLLTRCPWLQVTGVDISTSLLKLARLNHHHNGLAKNFQSIESDIQHLELEQPFDHVMSNPPFLEDNKGPIPKTSTKATAHVEGQVGLNAWIETCLRYLKPKGTLTLIFCANRGDELISVLRSHGGGIRVTPILPKTNSPAKRIVLRYRKGIKSPFILDPGFILHHEDGTFTPQAQRILRGGGAF